MSSVSTVFPALPVPVIPIVGSSQVYPVHRIYCVGRNYEDHAKEMGFTGREAPFFFMKPADAVVAAAPEQSIRLPYPSLTHDFHHEIELVVAIGSGGRDIPTAEAHRHIFGYAVGLDMTRRDLQNDMKKQGRPWSIGKGFDASAPLSAIVPAAEMSIPIESADIWLKVNGELRQQGHIGQLIWNIAETIEHLSKAWTLQPGDLIFTGTPKGVGAVVPGDRLEGHVDGLPPLQVEVF